MLQTRKTVATCTECLRYTSACAYAFSMLGREKDSSERCRRRYRSHRAASRRPTKNGRGPTDGSRHHLPHEIPERRLGKDGEVRRYSIHDTSPRPMQHLIASRHAAYSLHRATCIRPVRLPRVHCHSNKLVYITCASNHFNRLPRENDARRCHH